MHYRIISAACTLRATTSFLDLAHKVRNSRIYTSWSTCVTLRMSSGSYVEGATDTQAPKVRSPHKEPAIASRPRPSDP
jgi:hypothetical protein